MVRGIVNNFICSSFFSFLHLHVCRFSLSCFPLPVHFGTAFKRMFTSRCLCAIIRQCTITLSQNTCAPIYFLFVLLNCNGSLSSAYSVYLHFLGHKFSTSTQFLFAAREQQLPSRTFLLSYKRRVGIPTKVNQVTCSEVILLQDPTEKCPRVSVCC